MRISLLFFLSFFLHINPVYSEVYKWIDENGKTVYGDKPVSENADIIKIKKKPVTDTAYQKRIAKQKKLLDVMQDERNEKIADEKEKMKKEEKQQQQCAKLKKELQQTRNAGVLYEETDDPDNPHFFTDEEREAEIEKYVKYLKDNC